MQKQIGTTTSNLKDILKSLSATSNLALTGTTTNPTSGSYSASGKKTTPLHISYENKFLLSKNVGPSTTNTLLRTLQNRSSPPSSLLSRRQGSTRAQRRNRKLKGEEKVALGDKANRHLDPGVSGIQVKLSSMTKLIH